MSVEQVLGLYNYWIVIFLMMTGFYIVIARSNLIKTVIGLNIFQISVILLYVSMGKISGGTAPIVPPALVSHGHSEVSHGAHDHGDHGSHEHATAAHDDHGESHGHNDDHQHEDDHGEHSSDGEDDDSGEHAGGGHDDHSNESGDASKDGHSNSDSETGHGKVIYSNPLPSVLMLTAIVVGIATTALALALIVRIREDYGTIEEDEILELDRAS